jgi:hypothetical protein
LDEKPYKEYSSAIREMYDSLNVKCFAYFPCNDDEENSTNEEDDLNAFWRNVNQRRTGSCYNNSKVIVFDSTDDYDSYLKDNLNRVQLALVSKLLVDNQENFMPERKRTAMCRSHFPNIRSQIVENFDRFFLSNETKQDDLYSDDMASPRPYIRQTINVYPKKNMYNNLNKSTSSQTMVNFFLVLTSFFLISVTLTFVFAFALKLCSKKYAAVQLESQV